MGFDRIITNILDNMIQDQLGSSAKEYMKVSAWKLMIFGMVLILMMRFRPEGLLPEARQQLPRIASIPHYKDKKRGSVRFQLEELNTYSGFGLID